MRFRSSLLYLAVVSMIVLAIVGAFVGGSLLAPAVNETAQAAPRPVIENTQAEIVAAYEQTMIDIYEAVLPSVVSLRVTKKIEHPTNGEMDLSPFFGDPDEMPEQFFNRGQGSGFVWDETGHIVTNYHVVANASNIDVIFSDGTIFEAEVVGVDPESDLAVVKVDSAAPLQPVALGDSDTLRVGQIAIALGSPLGQESTMTTGIVSAVDRTIRSGNTLFSIPEVIQTDAAINPGNSGGPLLNRHGEVLGINTMILSRTGSSSGIGFAVPVNIARRVVPVLIEGESYEYSWLGITGQTLNPEVLDAMDLPQETQGVLVIALADDGPADEAGLQGSDKTIEAEGMTWQFGGDIITAVDGEPLDSMDELIAYLVEETRPGDEIELEVIHEDGSRETITVILGKRSQANLEPERLIK